MTVSKIKPLRTSVEPLYMEEPNPLGPTNYTGSNTATPKYRVVDRVQTPNTKILSSSLSFKDKPELAGSKGEQEQ
jgi:hypothetical protein